MWNFVTEDMLETVQRCTIEFRAEPGKFQLGSKHPVELDIERPRLCGAYEGITTGVEERAGRRDLITFEITL